MASINNQVPFDNMTGTYFLDYYIRKDDWADLPESNTAFSRNLLDFKNNANEKVWASYTVDLMKALAYISERQLRRVDSVYMVTVPSSDPLKQVTMKKTVKELAKMSADGTIELFTHCAKQFLDDSNLIMRIKPIKTAHLSGRNRPGVVDHINSMALQIRSDYSKDAGYVIMDDIVTRGTQMQACYMLLRRAGINKENIARLAIGKTR